MSPSARDWMGKVVLVEQVYAKKWLGDGSRMRTWERCKITPRAGWFVGSRVLQNGVVNRGQGYEDSTTFTPKSSVRCAMVVFWPTMAPLPVPWGWFDLTDTEPVSPAKHDWESMAPSRKALWAANLEQFRDEKGRFV